jgi:penicillin-binding protein 2
LNSHKAEPELTFNCNGKFAFGNKTFSCWEKKGHGSLDMVHALAKSCNVYFYQLGLKTGGETLQEYARKFHLGEPTGIDLMNEKSGLVPSNEWKLKKLHDRWQAGDTINMAIGQGPLWVTPMQIASMISIVANKGTSFQPYVVDSIVDPMGKVTYKAQPRRKSSVELEPRVWELLYTALKLVVQNGTAGQCCMSDLIVAGKTGTAQNPQGADHAWFASFAPADDPQLAVVAIVENGGHGSSAAVPIARRIYRNYFKLDPDTVVAEGSGTVRSAVSVSSAAVQGAAPAAKPARTVVPAAPSAQPDVATSTATRTEE